MGTASVKDFEEPEITTPLATLRHSTAHVMAHAVQKLWPDAKFGIGPTIEDGFYYDIDLAMPFAPEHLEKIEKEMRKIVAANAPFVRRELSTPEAIQFFRGLKQPYKVEIIEGLRDQAGAQNVSLYQEGDFTDLCRGPHIQKTGEIKAFKLLSIAGAYWRGNEKNPQMQRIYGTAFLSQAELDEHLHLLEEAKRRDHRKLGKEMGLFSFHPEAPAMPFFHPKGTVIYNRLVQYMRDLYKIYNYQEVITPQILEVGLWHKSGHYENYKDHMYFCEIDEREFAVKPMNCPAATFIYAAEKRSYRDLPLRLADFGRLHRYERSGVTAGITRTRSFCQDDAHIFCTPEQIESEIRSVSEMVLRTYAMLGFETTVFLSTRPEKRTGSEELWDRAESSLEAALKSLGLQYTINPGDGAFYGPKIDFNVKDALKRNHQLGTIQLDFNLGERFGLKYVGADNTAHTPVVVHRAVLGSLERFIGVMIEHTAGNFPFWLAPVQARMIPITEKHVAYCFDFKKKLEAHGIRVDIDDRNESMGLKTREAQTAKIPYSLVAGDREIEGGGFAVRKYGEQKSATLAQSDILKTFEDLNTPKP